ncbi:hypothetical protein ACKWTF_004505 [Chironomus riparius]
MIKTEDSKYNYQMQSTDMYMDLTIQDSKAKHSHRSKYIKILSSSIIFYLLIYKQLSSLSLHIVFCLPIVLSVYALSSFVEKETVKAIKNFGILYTTYYSFNIRKSTVFIPSENIYKIVINEMKHLNQIDFYLQILTTKELQKKSPTIVIKNNLPCLRLMYQKLSSMFHFEC